MFTNSPIVKGDKGMENLENEVIETNENLDSVEGSEVATEQVEELETPESTTEGGEITEDESSQDTIDNSKAFAERLRVKTEKEAERIRQEYENQYGKTFKLMEREAKKYGMTTEEYIAELERVQAEEEEEAQKAADQEKYGELPPEVIEKLKKAEAIETQEKEAAKWQDEIKAFKAAFPEIKSSEQIPDDVLAIRQLEGCSLTAAYKIHQFESLKANTEQIRIQTEQETIKKLRENSNTPGALGGQAPENTGNNIKDMSSKDFNEMIEKVKRGEIKSF
jgi:hypothetical protein